jgi:hypothetical protein
MCLPYRRRHLRVSVPITFRDQAEYECRDYEKRYSFLNGSETKSLPHFIEFETPGLSNQGTNLSKCVWLKTVAPLHNCLVRRCLRQARLSRIAALQSGRGGKDRQDLVVIVARH